MLEAGTEWWNVDFIGVTVTTCAVDADIDDCPEITVDCTDGVVAEVSWSVSSVPELVI